MSTEKEKKLSKLAEAYKSYTEGNADAPIAQVHAKAISTADGMLVTITGEIRDLEEEIVDIAGLELEDPDLGVPFIDAHDMNGSIVNVTLGRVKNLRKLDDGKTRRVDGVINFADTPNGQIAKTLYEGGFITDVSIGFLVKEYDLATQVITKSLLLEVSGVVKGANQLAKVHKSLDFGKELDKSAKELEKVVSNYREIHPKIKEYRRLCHSEELCSMLNYQKTGEELVDLKNIYDLIIERLSLKTAPVETQPAKEDTSANQGYQELLDYIAVMREEIKNI